MFAIANLQWLEKKLKKTSKINLFQPSISVIAELQ